jgi:lysophospholipase L1-like esterase
MKITDKFQKIKTDLSSIGLRRGEFVNYFCTPLNSVIFADLGVDGIHFCIIPVNEDESLENSPVYVVSPCMTEHYIEPVAENFSDFLSLVAITKDAGAMECISYITKEAFINYLKDIPGEREEIIQATRALIENFTLKDIEDVYDYVRSVQRNVRLSNIKFSSEYYEVTGEVETTSATCTMPIKVFIAGDSTVQTFEEDARPIAGWGQFIGKFFTENVQFVNHAIAGRSSKTFAAEGRLDRILMELGEKDYLFIQMGHNDSTESKPERYTEPFTEYKRYLKMYIDGARQRKAIPVLITPVGTLNYKDGEFFKDFSDYCAAMKQLAVEENVMLIDLMEMSVQYYSSLGYEAAYELFMVSHNGTDHVHFNKKGAEAIARLVSQAVGSLNIEISRYVNNN